MRSYHLLRSLAREHEVHLLTLAKDPNDLHYKEVLEQQFASVSIVALHPLLSKLYALFCLCSFLPLTLGFFFSLRARRLAKRAAASHSFDATIAFCSSTAHYATCVPAALRIVDFVDIDSEKWRQYAAVHSFPKSWLYRLEHKRLARVERAIHETTTLSLVTSEIEKARLLALSDDNGSRVLVIPQGVDLAYYADRQAQVQQKRLVFTGQMDYLPNIDGVLYFYQEVYPRVKAQDPDVELYIVGRHPSEELRALCPEAVVTGEVTDIREYLHSAAVVIAPLRLAFGMQSKILEAMASGIPVVASDKAAQSLWAKADEHLFIANDTESFANYILRVLEDGKGAEQIATAARRYVAQRHDWNTCTLPLLELLRDEYEDAQTVSLEASTEGEARILKSVETLYNLEH